MFLELISFVRADNMGAHSLEVSMLENINTYV